MKLLLVVASLLVAQAAAHVCLLSPHQRGSMQELNAMGSKDCLLLDGPCGNRTEEMPVTTFMAGENVSIVFQKNLDHWYSENPGMFNVMLMMDGKMMKLLSIPDTSVPSGTIYTPFIAIPDMPMEKAVLEVVYVTNNPKAPADFYQCADIRIMKRG